MRSIILCVLGACSLRAGELPGDWRGNYPPCDRHEELLKHEHMNLGVRFLASDPGLAAAFARAMDFWAGVLDMEWHEEPGRDCAIQVVNGDRKLFHSADVARAQFPDRPSFQGWIAFNPKVELSAEERYMVAVHEVGHMLGLPHNPNARSVMFFLCVDGPVMLDAADLEALAARHRLRVGGAAPDARATINIYEDYAARVDGSAGRGRRGTRVGGGTAGAAGRAGVSQERRSGGAGARTPASGL